jgi:hypothetical protein
VNAKHRVAQWLLAAAKELDDSYPGILRGLKGELQWPDEEPREAAKNINRLLDRLRKLGGTVCPAADLVVTEDDFLV